MNPNLIPIAAEKVNEDRVEYIYNSLRKAILDGKLEPGSIISQVQLATQYQVSRSPLREALKKLLSERLVEGDFNRRMRVSALDLNDFDQIYAMRIALEPIALANAMSTYDDDTRARLVEYIDEMDKAIATQNFEHFCVLHRSFHLFLVHGSGARIEKFVQELWDNSERYRSKYLHQNYDAPGSKTIDELMASQAEHKNIVKAAVAGNVTESVSSLVQHMQHSLDIVFSRAAPTPMPKFSNNALLIVQSGLKKGLS